ncbi:MAG: hypothetical protein FGM58_03200 [Acidimicrobiia bacterium]|nr:hypothetical protein [Acidimicrobiia bacterium]
MAGPTRFPRLRARDLEGLDVDLPDAFAGDRNLIAIAFRREHQTLVDSWAEWFEARGGSDPGLRFYEVPTIGRIWAPVRRFIDGGMAAAIREPIVLQRTFTIYGDVAEVTGPLGISDRSTITVLLVDRAGRVLWRSTVGCTEPTARRLDEALAAHRDDPTAGDVRA